MAVDRAGEVDGDMDWSEVDGDIEMMEDDFRCRNVGCCGAGGRGGWGYGDAVKQSGGEADPGAMLVDVLDGPRSVHRRRGP